MAEEWRDIPGYEGYYQASNMGNIRSVDRVLVNKVGVAKNRKGKMLVPQLTMHGYLAVTLCLDGSSKTCKVHRLVAMAFLPNKNSFSQVDHINGVRHDNRVENLRWVTPSENVAHSFELGHVKDITPYIATKHTEIKDLDGEEWRPVVGYEGFYEVSNIGRVKSVDRTIIDKNGMTRNLPGVLITPKKHEYGYYDVVLNKNGKVSTQRVHRLVAKAFLPPIEGKPLVDHINAIRTDNRVKNLRWVTYAENLQHAIEMGNLDIETSTKKAAATTSKPVIRSDGKIYPSISAAARDTGCAHSNIVAIVKGRAKSICGYSFKYAEQAN